MSAHSFKTRLRAVARAHSVPSAYLRQVIEVNIRKDLLAEEQDRLRHLALDLVENGTVLIRAPRTTK